MPAVGGRAVGVTPVGMAGHGNGTPDGLDHAAVLGLAGAGHTMKIVNQVIVGVTIETVAEAVALAEAAGFTHAWFYDTQLLCSDVYATMALAAEHTRTMTLGTLVAIPSNRIAPVTDRVRDRSADVVSPHRPAGCAR